MAKNRVANILITALALSFIVLSVALISRSNQVRNRIEVNATTIGILANSNLDAEAIQDTLFSATPTHLKQLIIKLQQNTKALTSVSSNGAAISILDELDQLTISSDQDRKLLLESLNNFRRMNNTQISTLRMELAEYSETLARLWNYSHVLIVFACFLAVACSIVMVLVRRARKTINEAKIRSKQIIDHARGSIIICDNQGHIIEVNASACELLGFTQQELIGMDIEHIYDNPIEYEAVQRAIHEQGYFHGIIVNKTKHSEHKKVQLSANILKNEKGEVVATMGISMDLTQEIEDDEHFKYIINNASDIIYTCTYDGTITYLNDIGVNLLEYDRSELLGRNFSMLIDDEWKEQVVKFYEHHFEKKLAESYFEFKLRKKSGHTFWVGQYVKSRFQGLKGDQIESFFGIIRDIDDRKTAEIRLANSEARYRELFDNSGDLIQSIDNLGNFLYVNKSWSENMGYSEQELKELNLFDLIHQDSQEHCKTLFEEILTNKECPLQKVTYQLLTKNGDVIIVEGSISLSLTENGELKSIQTFLRNITAEKRAQELLEKSEQSLRQITETLSDVFYLYNIKEQKYEYISPNCEEVLGADQTFFYKGASHVDQFVHPEDVELLKNSNRQVDKGQEYEIEYRIIVNEETKWISEKSYPILNENGLIVSNSGICRDITDIKNAQKVIDQQNLEIQQSINYARNIQTSVLPTKKEISNIFSDSFVFYQPKDVLSGDFFVVDLLRTNEGRELKACIVADCTGHGVPGGVLSLLCHGLIKETFTHQSINSPAEALDYVRDKLVKLFRSDSERHINDGMDIAFCVFDTDNNVLHYASANLNIIRLRDGEIDELLGDKQHVGFNYTPQPFTNQQVKLEKGDIFVLSSDGYQDQFGGPRNKKFMKRNFHRTIVENHEQSMHELGVVLNSTINTWKGDEPQIDDITVVGVRI